MASRTVRQLREDVTARILTLTGWRETRVAPDLFGADADSIAHKAFAVLCGTTEDQRLYRGKPAEGTLVETPLEVHYTWRLAPKDISNSYDDALDGEQAIVNCLMFYGSGWPVNYKFQLVSLSRETNDAAEWVRGVIVFRIQHTLPLQ